jgi:glycosyltransferase involved in cell wall biosynthesis
MERERILIISHSYSPLLNPRAFRWTAISEKWAASGIKVDVITSWLPGLKRFEIHNGVEIHRVGGAITERLRLVLRPSSRRTTHGGVIESAESKAGLRGILKARIKSLARFFHDKIWKNIYWPDYACLWIVPASSKALELCEMVKYGSLITVSDPFSSHLTGKRVKKVHSELNWVVDIGDPFSFRLDNPTNNHALYKQLNFRKEAGVFRFSNAVTVTTTNTLKKYADLFPESASKISVIPPATNLSDIGNTWGKPLPPGGKLKLVYVGTLYRAIRNPEYLLGLFERLSSRPAWGDSQLHFYGGYDDCRDVFAKFNHLVNEKIFLHGLVSHESVVQAMASADVLINIGNDNCYQLPSKLAEYVSLGKPIINLHTILNDSSKEFLNGYPAVLNLHTHTSQVFTELVAKVEQFISRLPNLLNESTANNWNLKFCVENIASQYGLLLKQEIVGDKVFA